MIIPIRCTNCGNPLADKWRAYQTRIEEIRKTMGIGGGTIYIDATKVIETPEKKALDELGLDLYCCRTKFLTHVDLIEKI
jgi:DNA-directed RNA polymerase subunit N (RpoN/RPB10)